MSNEGPYILYFGAGAFYSLQAATVNEIRISGVSRARPMNLFYSRTFGKTETIVTTQVDFDTNSTVSFCLVLTS